VSSLRIFFVGGLMSYRALFGWLSPWIMIPGFFIVPIFQILLFTYIGRAAHLQSDSFFVIGNAIERAAVPCLFAMAATISGERWQQTLEPILATPAPRLPLFVGRSFPVILNGAAVSAFALTIGSLVLGVHIPASAIAPLALVILVTAASCTGLGLANAAVGLRVRETAVLGNIVVGTLLVVCGVNVPLDELPNGLSTIAQGLPLTHGIEAARQLASGATLDSVFGLIGTEALVGAIWGLFGYGLLRFFELQSFRQATLDRA
jgi:ABC-2 type transport system permease protein